MFVAAEVEQQRDIYANQAIIFIFVHAPVVGETPGAIG